MSLALDVSRVEQVLLMDGWHRVATASFELDAYAIFFQGSDEKMMIKQSSLAELEPL